MERKKNGFVELMRAPKKKEKRLLSLLQDILRLKKNNLNVAVGLDLKNAGEYLIL